MQRPTNSSRRDIKWKSSQNKSKSDVPRGPPGLAEELESWRGQIVLMMNANKDVIDGVMCKQLNKEDLSIKAVVFLQTRTKGPKTFFKGTVTIDVIWVSVELEVTAAAYLPLDPELEDHQFVVVNITKPPTLEVSKLKINPSAVRRLNFKVKQIRQKYIVKLKEKLRKHTLEY